MSLSTETMSPADISAVVNGGRCGDGFGFGDQSGWWIILLFLCLGGWGNGFGGNGGGNGGFYPYYLANNTDANVQRGFDTASLAGQLSGIQSAINTGFSTAEVASCNRAMADMERSFASQTAITGGLTNLSSQLAQCCCENRSATNDVKYTIASEASATRANATQNTQAILDKLCQLELDNLKQDNQNLRTQLNMATLSASQTAQNAFIQKGFSDEVDALYNRLSNCPVPSTPVYGRTPIFTCNNSNGCGCGSF